MGKWGWQFCCLQCFFSQSYKITAITEVEITLSLSHHGSSSCGVVMTTKWHWNTGATPGAWASTAQALTGCQSLDRSDLLLCGLHILHPTSICYTLGCSKTEMAFCTLISLRHFYRQHWKTYHGLCHHLTLYNDLLNNSLMSWYMTVHLGGASFTIKILFVDHPLQNN